MTIHFSNGRMHSSGLSCRDNASVTPMYIREKKTRGLYIGSSRRPTCLTLALDDGVDEEALEDSREGEYIEIGIVGPPHGVKGEFKVQSLTDWPEERLGQKGTRYLKAPESTFHMARLKPSQGIEKVTLMRGKASVYKGREVWIVKIKGINSPEEAQAIRGYTLMVHESVRDDLDDEDEFYVQQLIGLRVELMNNDVVGTVVDIMDGTGTHDVLCIEHVDKEGTILLPFAREIVPVVDITEGILQITPPEGLLEMYQKKPKAEKQPRVRRRKQM
jgi:16S rRNA processing protein RimM